MRRLQKIVSFALTATIDNDSSEHVQDEELEQFIESDLPWNLEGLEKDGITIESITNITFE
jgi:hypothetical protein